MPLGVALGAASLDGRMFITIRYCRAQFDSAGAERFTALLRAVLADDKAVN